MYKGGRNAGKRPRTTFLVFVNSKFTTCSVFIYIACPNLAMGFLFSVSKKEKKKVTVSQVAFSYSAICFNAGTHLCSLAAEDLQKRLTKANLANHIMNDHGLLGIHVDIECVR